MANISSLHSHCCGCGACFSVCPKNAIQMEPNKQGFLFPKVDTAQCVQCGLCVRRCVFRQSVFPPNERQQAFAVKHTNPVIRAASRSGGIFSAVSDWILEQGGVVYGCKMENCTTAIHSRAKTKEERDAFRGSKYIQSQPQHIYSHVVEDLRNGLWVLFSGTPCQVHALKSLCNKESMDKLICIDVVCHGVPSPKVWKAYLSYLEAREGKAIVSVDFRDKKHFGWATHWETVYFADGSHSSNTIFRTLFYDHYILRDVCFECPYKTLQRVSDISIADCWGIQEHYPEFDDNKGVSLVLVNTEKGRMIYNLLSDIDQIPVDINKLMQPCLKENWPKPTDYETFWKYYYRHSFHKVIDKYVYHQPNLSQKIYHKVRVVLGHMYRKTSK